MAGDGDPKTVTLHHPDDASRTLTLTVDIDKDFTDQEVRALFDEVEQLGGGAPGPALRHLTVDRDSK